MNEVVLEAVSPFGVRYGGNEKWVNFDKSSGLKKDDFHAGDSVIPELNKGGFITSMKLVTAAPPKKAYTGKPFNAPDPEKSAKMARGAAVKVVFGSQFVYDQVKDMADGEGFDYMLKLSDEVSNYIEKGR